jgi:hypothetical protein
MASDRPVMKAIRLPGITRVVLTDLQEALDARPLFTFSQKRFRFTTIATGDSFVN